MSEQESGKNYCEFSLGSFSDMRSIVSELGNKFPSTYSLTKIKDVDGLELWMLSEQVGDVIESVIFLVRGDNAFVIGQDSFSFMKNIFAKML